jgi:phosphoglycerate transport regulatory protein PgtC
LLQGYGWTQCWSLLTQIGANAQLVDSGSTFITDEVASGRSAVGVTMDFFAASAIAKGLEIEFTYPELVGYSPAHVAILQASGNLDGARAFAAFTLSDEGQKLLFHPDIRKLPVKPLIYREKPPGCFDPFAASERVSYAYDNELGRARQELVSALFDAMITRHHKALKRMWSMLHRAEKAASGHPGLKDVIMLATALPLDERQVDDPALHVIFSSRDADARTRVSEIEKQWDAQIGMQYAQAEAMAREILDNAGKSSP